MTANEIIASALSILLDETGVRWTEADLLGDLNLAQRLVVNAKPEAGTIVRIAKLDPGAAQTLPTGSVCLVDMPRNVQGAYVMLMNKVTATATALAAHIPTDVDWLIKTMYTYDICAVTWTGTYPLITYYAGLTGIPAQFVGAKPDTITITFAIHETPPGSAYTMTVNVIDQASATRGTYVKSLTGSETTYSVTITPTWSSSDFGGFVFSLSTFVATDITSITAHL